MKILITITLLTLSLYASKVLVLNSNNTIKKYQSIQKSFTENFKQPYTTLDISKMSKNNIKEYLYDEYPDIVYTIGTKAYSYANMFIPEKTIFFSSIINYKRLKSTDNRYGVSNELHSGMNLTLIKSLFNTTKKLSIVYSEYTHDLYKSFKQNAQMMDIEIIGQKISKEDSIDIEQLKNTDGFILISDPILLNNENKIISLFSDLKELKIPIFAYHELFIKFGASLVISADNPTIGRQVSIMIEHYEKNNEFQKLQLPMGTNVVFNKKVIKELGVKYNKSALSIANKIIE